MQTSGRVEYMFVNVGEDIEIKLTVQHLRMMAGRDNPCINNEEYSAIQCEEQCFWRWSTRQANCRGSWMTGINLPICNDYEGMRLLIAGYRKYRQMKMVFGQIRIE